MDTIKESSVSPLEYFKIIFRRKWLFIIPTFAGLILGICAGIVLPKKYLSSTIILVEEGKSDNPLFQNLAVSTTISQRLNTIRESILGWHSLVELVKRLNLDKDVRTAVEFEKLILDIRKNVILKARGTNIIDLSYLGESPQITQAIVKNITEIFIEKNITVQNKETTDAINFIEEQLRVYRGKIKSAEIAQLQDQLDELLIDSTEKHPLVKQLREQVATKRAELEEENLQYTESEILEAQTTSHIIDEIKRALDNLQTGSTIKAAPEPEKDIYAVMLIDRLDNVMARDVKVNESIYNMLLQRLETAKITQRLQVSKEGTRYTILDPPRVPHKPIKPNRPLVAFVGLFLGTISGAGLVFASEFLDKSFLDVQEAKDYFGEPLLGAISRISTSASIQREKERQRWLAIVTIIGGLAAIIISIIIANIIR